MRISLFVGHFLFFVMGLFAFLMGEGYHSPWPMLLLAIPAYLGLWQDFGRRGLLFLACLSLYATGIEALSVTTGFPYGFFTYGEHLGPLLFDIVPWTVSFGWGPLVLGALFCAEALFTPQKPFLVSISTILLLIWADFVLDPGAVALSFWQWGTTGPYYTVPWVNFLGWGFSGLVAVLLWHFLIRKNVKSSQKTPKCLPPVTLLSFSLGNAFWVGVTAAAGMLVASWLGFLLSGVLFFIVWRQSSS